MVHCTPQGKLRVRALVSRPHQLPSPGGMLEVITLCCFELGVNLTYRQGDLAHEPFAGSGPQRAEDHVAQHHLMLNILHV